MKLKLKTFNSFVLMIGIFASVDAARAQHSHLNAGAIGTAQHDQLFFDNGSEFVSSSGYVKTLDLTNSGRYATYYQGGITLTALAATPAHAGPVPNACAPGSFIQFSMELLSGPTGGSFGFWDAGATNPTLSLLPGQAIANLFPLTESDGSPGSDPYGHIHGRRFSATKPGIYAINFRLFDTSTNGADGGPVHSPSQPLTVLFQAGVNIESVEPDEEEGHVHVRFGAAAGFSWQLEACEAFGPNATWESVGNPITGNDFFIEVIHEGPLGEQRFYRVRAVTP